MLRLKMSGYSCNHSVDAIYESPSRFIFIGLSLVFDINQDEYIPAFTEGAGIRVVVHDQSEMPFPEYNGIAVSPGYMTYIGATSVS
jgi:Amiloride-sensitive sodium channel